MVVLVASLNYGLLLALLAFSYSLTFGVLRVINFALGEAFMTGAVTAFLIQKYLNIQMAPILIVVVPVLIGVLGIAVYFIGFHLLMKRFDFDPIQPLISSLGISFIMQNIAMLWFNSGTVPMVTTMEDPLHAFFYIFMATAMAMGVIWFVVWRTRWGLWMRAIRDNRILAWDKGIDVTSTAVVTFFLSYFTAGLAGVLWALYMGTVRFDMGFVPGIKAFAAAVVGGMGDILGAGIGGVGLGVSEYLISRYVTMEYRDVLGFLLMILVLVVRPRGLLNRGSTQ